MLRWYNDPSLKHARMSLHDCSGSRRRQQKKEAKCPATHMNSFHPSLFALLASHGAVAEKKTDIKGDKHAQAKAMRRRKSSSLQKRGEGGEEMERKGRREGEREGGGRIERHGERIPSQIGLGQFVVTKKKKRQAFLGAATGNDVWQAHPHCWLLFIRRHTTARTQTHTSQTDTHVTSPDLYAFCNHAQVENGRKKILFFFLKRGKHFRKIMKYGVAPPPRNPDQTEISASQCHQRSSNRALQRTRTHSHTHTRHRRRTRSHEDKLTFTPHQ